MVFVCTYSNGNVGVGQELVRYLAGKKEDFCYLEHPMAIGDGMVSKLDEYAGGRMSVSRDVGTAASGAAGHYLRCSWRTYAGVRRRRDRINVFVGHSNVDAVMAALALRGTGAKVVYCSIDYMPRRFPGALLNTVYKIADRLAYRMSAAIWHSYPNVTGLKPYAVPSKCFTTLHGNNFHRITRPDWQARKRMGLVYLGGVTPAAHLEDAIRAVKVLSGKFGDVSLDVIGTSPDRAYMAKLKALAAELAVPDRIKWHGIVEKSDEFERIMAGLGVGLCLYEMTPALPSWYQLPGKAFAYAACGLPTVVLDASGPIAGGEIRENGMGLVTPLSGLEKCLSDLFSDPARHRELSESSTRWAAQYDWKDKFDRYLGAVRTV